MNVFLTGGSGFIGQATITALRERGHEVTALVRNDAAAAKVAGRGVQPVHGGLADLDVLTAAAQRADAAMHLAQDYGPDSAAIDLAAATAIQDGIGSRPYVHTGGLWSYGDTAGIVDETAPYDPPPITSWRAANEARVLSRAESGGHPVLVMPALVHGNGGGLIAAFVVEAARRGVARYLDTGDNHWTVVHVDDLAELYVAALSAPAGSRYAGVDDRQTPTMRQIAEAASLGAGRPGTATSVGLEESRQYFGPFTEAFALDQRMSSARARNDLGWHPRRGDVLSELSTATTA